MAVLSSTSRRIANSFGIGVVRYDHGKTSEAGFRSVWMLEVREGAGCGKTHAEAYVTPADIKDLRNWCDEALKAMGIVQ